MGSTPAIGSKICEWCNSRPAVNRFCSLSCATSWQSAARAWRIKYCCRCGSPFDARRTKARKKYCTRSCAASANNQLHPKRTKTVRTPRPVCLSCGIHCRGRCHYLQRWLNGQETGLSPSGNMLSVVREWVRSSRGEACWECGWAECHSDGRVPVQIDHIDGNPLNNSVHNLRLLCPNCHSLTPFFGSRNKGRGRTSLGLRARGT